MYFIKIFHKILFYYLLLLLFVWNTRSIKVDVHGTVYLGQDVVNSITRYLIGNTARRSDDRHKETLEILNNNEKILKESELCGDIIYCNGKYKVILDHYILSHINTMDGIVLNLIKLFNITNYNNFIKQYNGKMKEVMVIIKRTLKESENVVQDAEELVKLSIKKISGIFVASFITFFESWNMENVIVTKNIIISFIKIEAKEELKICEQERICKITQKCTDVLNSIVQDLLEMPKQSVKDFLKILYEELSNTMFYSFLEEDLENKLKNNLNDMVYSENSSIKKILQIILNYIKDNHFYGFSTNSVSLLMHVILSDLDYIFEKSDEDFKSLLNAIDIWKTKGTKPNKAIRQIISKFTKHLSSISEIMLFKLKSEVKIFLELIFDQN